MPTSTRKSIGQTRNRPHIPYRHDDYRHGKRTGMNVEVVDRGSDDFEPFDKVMSQADARTPPRVQGRKKKQQAQLSPVYDDSNGEISMDIDDTLPYESPMAYYSNQRVPTAPNSVRRVGSSSRPVRHSPDTNFDEIPSPRPASRRQSRMNGKNAGPSRLSQSYIASNDSREIPGGSDSEENRERDPFPALSPPPASPEQPSFSQMDQEEEEEEEQEVTPKARRADQSSRSGRKSVRYEDEEEQEEQSHISRKRRQSPVDDDEVEEEISQALQDVDMEEVEEEQVEQQSLSDIPEEPEPEEEQAPVKKGKKGKKRESMSENAEPRPKKKPRTEKPPSKPRGRTPLADKTPEPHVVRPRSVSPENPEGLRRSRRYRYKPLEYWRCEKVVYGREEDSGKPNLVAPIREIVRLPKEDVQPLGGKKTRKWKRAPSKSQTVEPENYVYNPEEGWDEGTIPQGHVVDFTTKTDVERRIVYTAAMVEPVDVGAFKFQKIFGDGDFIAAGQLIIPVGSEKPSKGTKDNTYVFYVIEGAVTLKIHTTSFVVCSGGCFLVPRGNVYYIKNISQRTAKLFFAQARKVPADAEDNHLLPQVRNSTDGPERGSTIPRESTERISTSKKKGTMKAKRAAA